MFYLYHWNGPYIGSAATIGEAAALAHTHACRTRRIVAVYTHEPLRMVLAVVC